jgi:hypothetical protein
VTHLYRKSRARAIGSLAGLFLLFTFSAAQAQRPELRRPEQPSTVPSGPAPVSQPKHSARAIGVLEFLPGGGIRLVPVALWIDGKYYDASLYAANPEPLAVEPGTVYEAQNYGQSAGLFVVNTPKLSNAGWIGDGRWTPRRVMDEQLAAKAAQQQKAQPKPGNAIFTSGVDEGPPVLRRPDESGSPAPVSASPKNPPASQPQATAQASASAPPASDDDPERPTLRKPVPEGKPLPEAKAQTTPTASPDENDPNRPLLTRDEPTSGSATKPSSKFPVSIPEANKKNPPGKLRSLAAISDAGKYENQSLLYTTTPELQQQLAQSMLAIALADMRTFANQHTPGPELPKNAEIKDYDLRSFDLDFRNSPTLVLTAKLPIPTAGSKPFVYYATIVARLDINGEPVKIFSSVTDTTHLDVFPHLELIDALDANANGRGDLLFRQYSDTGMNYGLYRVLPYQMEKVFEGGSSL